MTVTTYTDLTNAVIAQMDSPISMVWDGEHWSDENHFFDTMRDITNHGAASGFHGFIYYSETAAFYDANAELIWNSLCDDAEATGNTLLPIGVIASFRTFINDEASFKNALAWYALERAANEVVESLEEVT
jgi:hypothetical protein